MYTLFCFEKNMNLKRSNRAPVVMPSELINISHPFYDSPTVHIEMINDKVRTLAFKQALKRAIKPGDVVFDLGTGTGILAMFAAKLGAEVYAIDSAGGIFEAAKVNISRNKLNDKIKLITYTGDKISLPKKADVVVSECLGHFGFDEGMIKAVTDSKYLLKNSGVFIPGKVRLCVAAVSVPEMYDAYIDTWKKLRYGLDFSHMRSKAVERIYIATFSPSDLVSYPTKIIDFTMGNDSADLLKGGATITIKKAGKIHGLVGWFESELVSGLMLSTSPLSAPTHWEQCFLPLIKPLAAKAGDKLSIGLSIKSYKHSEKVKFKWIVQRSNYKS